MAPKGSKQNTIKVKPTKKQSQPQRSPLRLKLTQHRRPPEPQGLVERYVIVVPEQRHQPCDLFLLRGLHTVHSSFRLGSLDCHNNQSFRYRDMQSGS